MKKLIILALLLFFSANTYAQTPFDCDNRFYQVFGDNGNSLSYDLLTNTTVIAPNSLGQNINAMGYNPADNFGYGIIQGSAQLGRIGSDGFGNDLGVIAGLPVVNAYFAGDFAGDGLLYVFSNSNANPTPNVLHGVNTTTQTVDRTLTMVGFDVRTIDFAYNPTDNHFYASSTDNINSTLPSYSLFKVNMDTGQITVVGPTGITDGFASMFSDGSGNIYGHNRQNGVFYQFNTETGEATPIGFNNVNDIEGNVDGFYCFVNPGPNVALVPTLSEWGLIAMVALLGVVGFIAFRRRAANV